MCFLHQWIGVCLANGYQSGPPGYPGPPGTNPFHPGYQHDQQAQEAKEETQEEDRTFIGYLKKFFKGKGAKSETKGRDSTLMKRVQDLWIYIR